MKDEIRSKVKCRMSVDFRHLTCGPFSRQPLIAGFSVAAFGAAPGLFVRAGNILFMIVAFHFHKQVNQGVFQFMGVIHGKVAVLVVDDPIRRAGMIGLLHQQAIRRELIYV